MTVSSTTYKTTVAGNGATTTFTYSFPIIDPATALLIYTDASGNQTTIGAGYYTLTGYGLGSTGGTFTYPLSGSGIASGTFLTLVRTVPYTQTLSLPASGAAFPPNVEAALDNLTYEMQQVVGLASSAIRQPAADTTTIGALPAAAARAMQMLGFDGLGNPIAAQPSSAPVSSVMQPVTASSTLAIARNLLGVAAIATPQKYGALGDGTTDDTSAIQAAINAEQTIYFPPTANGYLVSSAIAISGTNKKIYGAGFGSLIKTNSATADIFDVTGTNIEICSIGFSATVTKSAGIFVSFNNASFSLLHDFYMYGFFIGVKIWGTPGATGVHVSNGYMANGVASLAQGIAVFSGGDIVVRDVLIWSGTSTNIQYGVVVYGCGDLTLDHVQIVFGGLGLYIGPIGGNVAQDVTITGCFFDTCGSGGIAVGGAGTVQLVKIANSWVATATGHGIFLNPTGGGVVQQVDILNTISSNNTQNGLLINSTACVFTNVIGCSFGSNGISGASVVSNVGYFRFIGCSFGTSGQFVGNTQYGISLASGCNAFAIEGNFFNGNTIGAINFGGPSGSPGSTYWVKNNVGFVTQNSGALTSTAGPSSFTITHGLSVTPNIQDISLTLTSGLGAAASFWASAPTSTTFNIVFNAAPGAGVGVGWLVRSAGA